MKNRMTIFRDGEWRELELRSESSVKYNKISNKIANFGSRELSHTNTFDIPPTAGNLRQFNITLSNPKALALAFNTKYIANYYIGDKLFSTGFIVINNTNDGNLNLNFIDQSLSLVETWSNITLRGLLQDDSIEKPADYQASIDAMRSYPMGSGIGSITPLEPTGYRGYSLSLFPNNLNVIGDKWQIHNLGGRLNDQFSPFQSRPLFNAKSVFDLATESFGYNSIYDVSVDWSRLNQTYIVDKGLSKSDKLKYETFKKSDLPFAQPKRDVSGDVLRVVTYPTEMGNSFQPSDKYFNLAGNYWYNEQCFYKPNLEYSNNGEIIFTVARGPGLANNADAVVYATLYLESDVDQNVAFPLTVAVKVNTVVAPDWVDGATVTISIDKRNLTTLPGYSTVAGLLIELDDVNMARFYDFGPNQVEETYTTEPTITFDEYLQYEQSVVDLTHAAPQITLRKLLLALMAKEGILFDINEDKKTVRFYSYRRYTAQRDAGNWADWSDYFLEYSIPKYNTSYGDKYAKNNVIGLGNPYSGNTKLITLKNQGTDSKYTDSITNYSPDFNDVTDASVIEHTSLTYTEYTCEDISLIEDTGNFIEGFDQKYIGDAAAYTLEPTPMVANVNYSLAPVGVEAWYKIIDESVKIEALFLVPEEEIRSLDVSLPIYIEKLGGFYIVEEIAEYTNSQEEVAVRLIKLPETF